MLKRLTRKLIILSMLIAAFAMVSSTPVSAAIYCAKFIDGEGNCIVMCCTDTGECISSSC